MEKTGNPIVDAVWSFMCKQGTCAECGSWGGAHSLKPNGELCSQLFKEPLE